MLLSIGNGLTKAIPVPGSPTCAISVVSTSTSAPFTATITFEFGVTGFVIGDITVSGATLSAFNPLSTTVYTVLVTPLASPSSITLQIPAGVCNDIISGGPNSASPVSIIQYDTTVPTFSISAPSTALGDFTATFTASLPVTGFVVGDITVTNATLSSFTPISTTVYTVVVSGITSGNVGLSVDASVCVSQFGRANSGTGTTTVTFTLEYLTSIYEWWPANRGLQLDSAAAPTFVVSWTGFINGYKEATSGSPLKPVAGISTFDSGDGITLSTTTNPGITGAISLDFAIKKTLAPTSVCTLFDSNTNVPRLKFFLRISTVNSHMGFSYNGVTYDAGMDFPYGGAFQILSLCVDGANNVAKVILNNTQIYTTTITGGALNANSGQNLALFKSVSGTENFGGSWLGVRIYNEYHSTVALNAIHLGAFTQKVVDLTPIRWIAIHGQSNVGPPTADNIISNYDIVLQGGFTRAKLWNFVSNLNYYINIPANSNVYLSGSSQLKNGPFLRMIYEVLQNFPDDEVRLTEYYIAATSLEVTWNPFSGTSAFDTALAHDTRSLATLEVEERNVVSKTWLWIQGEADAGDLTMATNYHTNLTQLVTKMRTTLGSDTRMIISKLTTRAITSGKEPYQPQVTQAQLDVVSENLDTFLIDTDDPQIDYPIPGGVHYAVAGLDKIGEVAATFVG